DNPFMRFAARFTADVSALAAEPPQAFHQYAFTTLRQCGSCCELAGSYLRWLDQRGEAGLSSIAQHFEQLAGSAKALQLAAARAVLKKRAFSPDTTLDAMASEWARALEQLQVRYAS
ncbi:MAG TPA: DUF1839 family protein, partial [Polyangiaceae bacterium]|nr:DUF1839 family protein [Polyangiaceae bacterium]